MNCDACIELLNAELDRSTHGDFERESLTAHLADCSACAAISVSLTAQHAQLRDMFADVRPAAARVINATLLRLQAEVGSPLTCRLALAEPVAHDSPLGPHPSLLTPRRSLSQPYRLLLAMAAGFVLALLLYRPWQRSDVAGQLPIDSTPPTIDERLPTPKRAPVQLAQLALATGPVEVRSAALNAWAVCPTSGNVEPGSVVRTADGSKAEFDIACGSQVRLNDNTAIKFDDDRKLEFQSGQLWSCTTADEKPFTITMHDTTVTAQKAELYMTSIGKDSMLTVVDGTARVTGKDGGQNVAAGSKVRWVDGQLREQQVAHDLLLDTGWIAALLIQKGDKNEELDRWTNRLLARVGEAKMSYLYEEEIRRLGEFGVTPLVRYVQASAASPDESKRGKAAGMIGDLAGVGSIPDLIELLFDSDANVRFHSARALHRLTGQSQGFSSTDWQNQNWSAAEPVAHRWRQWWEQQRDRYPTVREPAPRILKKG